MAMFIAVTISLACLGVALYIVCDSYINDSKRQSAWAEITISLLLGVWVSGKPKFFNKNKV